MKAQLDFSAVVLKTVERMSGAAIPGFDETRPSVIAIVK